MVEDLIDAATDQMYREIASQAPLVASEDDTGTRWQLYHLVDGSSTADMKGLYAVTSSEDGVVETVRFYGVPENDRFTTPKHAYTQHCPDEFRDTIIEYYEFLKDAELNSMRDAFTTVFNEHREQRNQRAAELESAGYDTIAQEMRDPDPSTAVAVNGRTLYIDRDILDRERTLEDLVESDQRALGDSRISEEDYEAVDWDALGEATREAMFEWRRSKADGVVDDDWEGYAVLVSYEDWRPTARDLALHTSLSDAQAVATAILSLDFPQSTVADILGKDDSTISQQVRAAADKFVTAKKTAERLDALDSRHLSEVTRAAKDREEDRIATEEYERSKSPQVGFFCCPECGLDTGPYNGPANDGEFEADDPPEFIVGSYHPPRAQGHPSHSPVRVTCPNCDHEASENAFTSAWQDEHGKLPEPDHVPHPEPTASRLHKQARDAAESKRRQRDGGRY